MSNGQFNFLPDVHDVAMGGLDGFIGTLRQCHYSLEEDTGYGDKDPDYDYRVMFHWEMWPDEDSGLKPFRSDAWHVNENNGLLEIDEEKHKGFYMGWSAGRADLNLICKAEAVSILEKATPKSDEEYYEVIEDLQKKGLCFDPDDADEDFSGVVIILSSPGSKASGQTTFINRLRYAEQAMLDAGKKHCPLTFDARTWEGLRCLWEKLPRKFGDAISADTDKDKLPLTPNKFFEFKAESPATRKAKKSKASKTTKSRSTAKSAGKKTSKSSNGDSDEAMHLTQLITAAFDFLEENEEDTVIEMASLRGLSQIAKDADTDLYDAVVEADGDLAWSDDVNKIKRLQLNPPKGKKFAEFVEGLEGIEWDGDSESLVRE